MKYDKILSRVIVYTWIGLMCGGLLLCSLLATSQASPPPPGGTVHQMRIVEITDGDTVKVEVYYTIRVRLLDCWAPEIGRAKTPEEKERGRASKANLESYAKPGATGVVFVPTGVDHSDAISLNRYLGYIWLDDYHESLSEIQVRDGHAKVSK